MHNPRIGLWLYNTRRFSDTLVPLGFLGLGRGRFMDTQGPGVLIWVLHLHGGGSPVNRTEILEAC